MNVHQFVGPVLLHLSGFPGGVFTGCMSEGNFHRNVLRDDFLSDFGALDAPDYLARGSVDALVFSRFSMPCQFVARPGLWL